MPQTLTFETLHQYDTSKAGITIPIKLVHGAQSVMLTAKLDTGASCCIFRRDYGEALGLDIKSGVLQPIALADGHVFDTYGHDLTIFALGFELEAMAYFASDFNFKRDVLGRRGWIQQLRLGLVDYDGKLYVGRYDET